MPVNFGTNLKDISMLKRFVQIVTLTISLGPVTAFAKSAQACPCDGCACENCQCDHCDNCDCPDCP